jgi:hypothetical protein
MKAAICAMLGGMIATGVAAGDQPVISVPTMPPVYKDSGMVIYYMGSSGSDSLTVTEVRPLPTMSPARSGGTTAPITAPTSRGGQALVDVTKLPAGASDDALYSALLEEARARGLR